MTPWEIASKSEAGHQRALFAWANCAARSGFWYADQAAAYTLEGAKTIGWIEPPQPIPALAWLHAIHNQGHGDKIRGAKAKAEGVKAGVSDVFWPYTTKLHAGLYIELKRPSQKGIAAGRLSVEQIAFREYALQQGYQVKECFGWLEAKAAIVDYWGET